MATKLTDADRDQALARLPDWHFDPNSNALVRDFKFNSFTDAFAFMTKVALLAEAADHHPEWTNVYNKVHIALSTHTAGGVTEKDVALAEDIDGLGV